MTSLLAQFAGLFPTAYTRDPLCYCPFGRTRPKVRFERQCSWPSLTIGYVDEFFKGAVTLIFEAAMYIG